MLCNLLSINAFLTLCDFYIKETPNFCVNELYFTHYMAIFRFVTFTDMDGVRKACSEMNNIEFNGSPLRVMENTPPGGGASISNNRLIYLF